MPKKHDEPHPDRTPGLDRRCLLQAGALASSASLAGAAVTAWPARAATVGSARPDLYKVVFDQDHPAAAAFGSEASRAGLATQSIGRDVTSLWYDDLYHRWRRGSVAIAGLTPVPVAFCLELFAQDVGMRMVFRADHIPTSDGRLEHRITAPQSVLDRAELLDTATNWSRGAARLLSRCPADLSTKATRTVTSSSASGFAHDEPLVTWMMAPVSRT